MSRRDSDCLLFLASLHFWHLSGIVFSPFQRLAGIVTTKEVVKIQKVPAYLEVKSRVKVGVGVKQIQVFIFSLIFVSLTRSVY